MGLDSEQELYREVMELKQKKIAKTVTNSPLSCLLFKYLKFNANLLDYCTA